MTTMHKKSAVSETLRTFNEFTGLDDSGRTLVGAMETWFAAAGEGQREMMSFVSKRLEKDGETVREMLGSRNLADAMAIQSRWIEETLRDYNSEMTKLMTIYTKSANGRGRPVG
jgi:hypothetical protein